MAVIIPETADKIYPPMLEGFELPAVLAYCIQIPIWFIYVYDMINWIGNRNQTT